MSVIFGLDLAERTGVCVLNASDRRLVHSDSVKLAQRDSAERLLRLRELLRGLIKKFGTGDMAIEDVFLPLKTSRRTPISLGELRGVARLCAAEENIPVYFYPPARVKMAVTGSGRAEKDDVLRLIEAEFRIRVRDNNESDAISVAYTHWLSKRFYDAVSAKV